ncbi:hypothetical protein OBBRIDRAFT_123127 [Obba rivulosa]|uniref:RGS domain-containing protein n=1 Tax=Obba rivulosa TaxID=1052685 RepID=A0A8E2DRR9_9APHY|nr:hypothetical protein OBBRIDRAFT_123127 [Obba rivulosa]
MARNLCSLGDFEGYLAHREYSLENLHFVVWFQDYRRRFFALPADKQALSPGPTEFNFAMPTPARTAARIAESMHHADVLRRKASVSPVAALLLPAHSPVSPITPITPISQFSSTASAAPSTLSNASRTSSRTSHSAPAQENSPREGPSPALRPHEQPFREECARIVATFFCPGAAEELSLDSALRDAVIRDLTWNTHPDVFLAVYEEIYHSLETISLPRFLAAASVNINLPKQLYWYGVGLAYVLIGVLIALVLITCLPGPAHVSRSWRLFSVPFASLGWMSMYSGWRGFCTEVWSRGNTQLRVWELQELDTEGAAHWDRVLDDAGADHRAPAPVLDIAPPIQADPEDAPAVCAIAPFASAPPDAPDTPGPAPPHAPRARSRPLKRPPPLYIPPAARGAPFRRPPTFGPERVVRDPRIQALHRQVLLDMWWVGFWFNLWFVPLVLAVPGLRRT